MHATYPGSNDLRQFLIGAGMVTTTLTEAQSFMDEANFIGRAIEEWEKDTGYIPFLADDADVTIYYNPRAVDYPMGRAPMLDFASNGGPGGIVSVTSLTVGVTSTSTGTALTQNTHFSLRPRNAALNKQPYTYLEFLYGAYTGLGTLGSYGDSIVLVGKRGFWTQISEMAWNGILCKAAELMTPVLAKKITDGIIEWQDDDVRVKMGADSLSAHRDTWCAQYAGAVGKIPRRFRLS